MSREAMERAIATIVEMRNELAYGSRAFAGSIQTLALLRAALSAPAQQQAGTVQACSFPERDETKPAEQQGLFRKFVVRRVDGSDAPGGKHHGCEYFVIDMTNDQYAPVALRPYAVACRATHPALSADLQARFGDAPEQEPVDAEIDSQLKALRSEEAKKTNPRKNRSSPDRPRVYGNSAPQPAGTVQVPCFVILGPDDSTKFVSFAEDEDWAWIHYIDSLKLWYCAIKDKNGSHRIPGHRCIPASIVLAAAQSGEGKT